MWLTRFALNRPVIVVMLFVGLAIFGIISFLMLGRSQMPNVAFPVVGVFASYPGASPAEMEKLVIKPIEDQLDGLENVDQVSATAQEGTAEVDVQFNIGTNLDLAAIDVQRRVDTARVFMPSDMDPPSVFKNGSSAPLLTLALSSSSLSPVRLADVVNNQIVPELKRIPNVQTVDVSGTADPQFNVYPNPGALIATGATLSDVVNAISPNNANLPGGLLETPTQEATVAVHSEIESAQDILGIPLPVPGGANKDLRVGDVATAQLGHAEQRSISHLNGHPNVIVDLNRTIDSDEIHSTQIARAQVKQIEAEYPQIHFDEVDAPADFTQKALGGVWQSLFEGIVLTAIVLLLFLHAWRNAAVVMIAIPSSILSTFIVMHLLNFRLDLISLMGLSLIIGILVDDSIVVLENITRHRDMGESPLDAAIKGRTEIGGAAIAITMVDVVVFLPIAFLSGIVGKFLQEFGIVVVVATLFSLLVSFTLTPLLAAKWSVLRRSTAPPKAIAWFQRGYESLVVWYRTKALEAGLRHGTFLVYLCTLLFLNALMLTGPRNSRVGFDVFVAAVALIGSLVMVAFSPLYRRYAQVHTNGFATNGSALRRAGMGLAVKRWMANARDGGRLRMAAYAVVLPLVLALLFAAPGQIGSDFVPQDNSGDISMTVTYPAGTPIAQTAAGVDRLESQILKIYGIKSVFSTVGSKPNGFGSLDGGNYASLHAVVPSKHLRLQDEIVARIRNLGYTVPGATLAVAGQSSGSGAADAITYAVAGPDNEIQGAADKLVALIKSVPGTVNVRTGTEAKAPRLDVTIDRGKANVLGVSPGAAADAARIAIAGAIATKVRTSTGLVNVYVQFPIGNRDSIADLQNVRVRAADGMLVPLSAVATFRWTTAPTEIERLNRQTVVNVVGDLLPGASLGSVDSKVQKAVHQLGFFPPGVTLDTQGDTKFLQQTMSSMGIAILLSAFLVYTLMVILYGSFTEPLIVMFSVPVAVVGALLLLAISGQSLNLFSLIGIVMLFGLVAKNGILLVDYSNTLRKRGMRVREAVLEAAATRFRPILMTTCAMVLGMAPLALGFAEGAAFRRSMGTVIIGGLLSSLILTLFLVPMVYNTWMGFFERRADRAAVRSELEVPAHAI